MPRPPLAAALLLAAACLAGCDGGNGGSGNGSTWAGPPEPAEDGTVSVEEFAEYRTGPEERQRWEDSAELTAAEFLRLDERSAVRVTIAGDGVGEGFGPRAVVVTLDGLLDDSVRAERWELEFLPGEDGFDLESAVRTLRCHPGRGHQDFTPDPCI